MKITSDIMKSNERYHEDNERYHEDNERYHEGMRNCTCGCEISVRYSVAKYLGVLVKRPCGQQYCIGTPLLPLCI
jgi:hypothetical protein